MPHASNAAAYRSLLRLVLLQRALRGAPVAHHPARASPAP